MQAPALAVLSTVAAAVFSTAAHAQSATTSNYTTFAASLPTIRVIEPSKSGALTVRRGEVKADQIAGCPGLKIPAQVVFNQARGGATGGDTSSTR